jgi:hypothetical protein
MEGGHFTCSLHFFFKSSFRNFNTRAYEWAGSTLRGDCVGELRGDCVGEKKRSDMYKLRF